MSGSRTRGVAKPDAPHPISDPKLFLLGGISLAKREKEAILSWAGIRTRDIGFLSPIQMPPVALRLPNNESLVG